MSPLTADQAACLLRSLLPVELSTSRGTPVAPWPASEAESALADAALDSLELMHLAAVVSERCCLDESGLEDWLLRLKTPLEWADLIERASAFTSGMRFLTSGSTGAASEHLQTWSHIQAEAEALAGVVASGPGGPPRRLISWLPLHHLYGFMAGLALPAALGCERLAVLGDELLPVLQPGDVLVTVPDRWAWLARTRRQWPREIIGITSTAPMQPDVAARLHGRGLTGLLEIYGSTETSGVATRWQQDQPFQLLPCWRRTGAGEALELCTGADREHHLLPDHLQWQDETRFRLAGRRDHQVQVGGRNVAPAAVARRLEAMPGVAACAIRLHEGVGGARLKAFIVPAAAASSCPQTLLEQVRAGMADWPAPERPVHFSFGAALPVNAMGKLADWPV